MKSKYLVPDFYPKFQCKCGDCRTSCCTGWNVPISQSEYYKLLSLECTPELQGRIDRAFFIPRDADPDRFALLNHDWLGNCPLRHETGLCALQMEKGEECIPSVCRLYPRGVRSDIGEATLSNSCEGVVEMLRDLETPIRFVEYEIENADEVTGAESPERMALRLQCIGILQDTGSDFSESMRSIGRLITGKEAEMMSFRQCMSLLMDFASLYSELSPNTGSYCDAVLEELKDVTSEEWNKRRRYFAMKFPYIEHLMENLMVNHFFFEKFPYSETEETEKEEFMSLCGLCAFLAVLLIGNCYRLETDDMLTDMLSAVFRVVDHTRFHYNSHVLLMNAGFDSPEKAAALLEI